MYNLDDLDVRFVLFGPDADGPVFTREIRVFGAYAESQTVGSELVYAASAESSDWVGESSVFDARIAARAAGVNAAVQCRHGGEWASLDAGESIAALGLLAYLRHGEGVVSNGVVHVTCDSTTCAD